MMKRKTYSFALLLALMLFAPLSISAQIIGKNIVVLIQPDHADWNYKVGETAKFSVQVLRSSTPLAGVKVDIEAGPSLYPTEKKSMELKDGTFSWKGALKKPGFYTLKVKAHTGGKDYDGICSVAFSPEKIVPFAQCPSDFDQFWSDKLAAARKHDLNPTRRLLPERCTKDVNVYEVSYVNDGPQSRFYGILTVPVNAKAGSCPALLRVPGAGARPYAGDIYTAQCGGIVLEVGVHGIPVTMQQEVYDQLMSSALDGYWDSNVDDREKNHYRRIVTGAVRGADYLASLPEWDGQNMGVTGSSQGGFLSLAVAALDKRITAMAAVHDAMCDYEAECHGVAGGWPHYFLWEKPTQKKVEGARYYDGVNFARRITCPCWFSFGYNDEVVPPTSSYGTYNVVTAPKTLSVYQQTAHFWYQEQWDEWVDWLFKELNIKK